MANVGVDAFIRVGSAGRRQESILSAEAVQLLAERDGA
jgi:uridine phosphorylase